MNAILTATVFCAKAAFLATVVSMGVAFMILLIGKILSRGAARSGK